MKKIIKMTSTIIALIPLVGCSNNRSKVDQVTGVYSPDHATINLKEQYALTLTFFDGDKNIPYISMEELDVALDWRLSVNYEEKYGYDLYVYNKTSDHIYTFKNDSNDATLTINFNEGSYLFSDMDAFYCDDPHIPNPLAIYAQDSGILAPIFDWYTKPSPTLGYFKDYLISPISFGNKDYLPFSIALDLVKDTHRNNLVYTGEYIFILTNAEQATYRDFVGNSLADNWIINQNDPKFLQYAYKELCFSLSLHHGLRDRFNITNYMDFCERSGIAEEFTRSALDFNIATYKLFDNAINDYGHTSVTASYISNQGIHPEDYYSPLFRDHDKSLFQKARNDAGITTLNPDLRIYELGDNYRQGYKLDGTLVNVTDWEQLNTASVDTIFYTFDSFDKDLITKLKLFCKILNNPNNSNVKNFVFDISCNGGGLVYTLNYILTFIGGSCKYDVMDPLTKARSSCKCISDVNGDFLPDNNDKISGINFYIVASHCSFSCANAFACLAKRQNFVKVIGDTTGGGTCCVSNGVTCLGTTYRYSGVYELGYNRNGQFEDFEDGASADYHFTNYDEYYDRTNIVKNIING